MDHDVLASDVAAIKRFLDVAAPGWNDPAKLNEHRRRVWDEGDPDERAVAGHPDMVVDHDQTKADRVALGLDAPDDDGTTRPADEPMTGGGGDSGGGGASASYDPASGGADLGQGQQDNTSSAAP